MNNSGHVVCNMKATCNDIVLNREKCTDMLLVTEQLKQRNTMVWVNLIRFDSLEQQFYYEHSHNCTTTFNVQSKHF